MSDTTDPFQDDHFDDDMLAAEVSLGLLTGEALTQAERRARIDMEFAARVSAWDERFSQMTDDIAPVAPPQGLFRTIAKAAYGESRKRIWQKLGVIPALLGAGAAALVLILALQFGGLMQPDTPTATFVAQMSAEDNSLVVAAAYVQDGGRLFVEREIGAAASNRALELWLIAGDDAPVSLGILSADETIDEIIVPENLRSRLMGATLAISDEPLGGSPTGAPTGAVLAAGEMKTL